MSVDVPDLSLPRKDGDEAIARLALFVAMLAEQVLEDSPVRSFVMVGTREILERFGPVDIEHFQEGVEGGV
jgi:hypothetical protein